MRIVIVSVGTRGDIEPFLFIAELLKEKGHDVICAFPEQFEDLAKKSDIEFFTLGREFIELVESEDGIMAMGGNGSVFKKLGAYIRLYKKSIAINNKFVSRQHDLIDKANPDRIVYNGKSTYPIIWGITNPGKTILVSPVPFLIHYVKGHPHVGFNMNFGAFFNKLTYSLANYGHIQNVLSTTREFRKSPKITRKQIKKALLSEKMIYTISPVIFPKPDYWPSHLNVLGYHDRNRMATQDAHEDLERFIADHKKIVLITFGSMINQEPAKKTKLIIDILQKHDIAAIINTAAGGLVEPELYDRDRLYFVSGVSYERILPKMYGVIHHGGSGTTHLGLKYGCASLIIPHIIDQYVWNDIVSDLGAGPKGISINKINERNLEPLFLDLVCNESYKSSAMSISKKMDNEDFRAELYKTIIG